MKSDTPLFTGFYIKTLGKKRLGAAQKMVDKLVKLKEKDLSQLAECFRNFIPHKNLEASDSKAHSSSGLKIRVSVVRIRVEPPFFSKSEIQFTTSIFYVVVTYIGNVQKVYSK